MFMSEGPARPYSDTVCLFVITRRVTLEHEGFNINQKYIYAAGWFFIQTPTCVFIDEILAVWLHFFRVFKSSS